MVVEPRDCIALIDAHHELRNKALEVVLVYTQLGKFGHDTRRTVVIFLGFVHVGRCTRSLLQK